MNVALLAAMLAVALAGCTADLSQQPRVDGTEPADDIPLEDTAAEPLPDLSEGIEGWGCRAAVGLFTHRTEEVAAYLPPGFEVLRRTILIGGPATQTADVTDVQIAGVECARISYQGEDIAEDVSIWLMDFRVVPPTEYVDDDINVYTLYMGLYADDPTLVELLQSWNLTTIQTAQMPWTDTALNGGTSSTITLRADGTTQELQVITAGSGLELFVDDARSLSFDWAGEDQITAFEQRNAPTGFTLGAATIQPDVIGGTPFKGGLGVYTEWPVARPTFTLAPWLGQAVEP